jgi:hypothetical protein
MHTMHTRSLPRQLGQIGFQGRFAASEHHVEDLVSPQVAEGRRVALLPGKEMLIDAEHARTISAAALGEFAAQIILEAALRYEPAAFLVAVGNASDRQPSCASPVTKGNRKRTRDRK